MNQLTEQQRQAMNAEIFGGRKIEAIKLFREATGCQLVDAKKAVEDVEKDLRQREPTKFTHRAGKFGCMSAVAVVALLVSAALAAVCVLHS
jgi:hypothetical protein